MNSCPFCYLVKTNDALLKVGSTIGGRAEVGNERKKMRVMSLKLIKKNNNILRRRARKMFMSLFQ
ncbi:hypothetical protein NIES267_01070 [Calothrix parasitica NIES-267]|uniref:Uncharacterized protein n=1 Tax=Calothrix parasitica NIES-267 TaxID=1973488 RepID=A0A1Z4LHD3_9CYAN|nr:hypothetical protein NIES267_01070 [Calothrix parasitica NIES-267]